MEFRPKLKDVTVLTPFRLKHGAPSAPSPVAAGLCLVGMGLSLMLTPVRRVTEGISLMLAPARRSVKTKALHVQRWLVYRWTGQRSNYPRQLARDIWFFTAVVLGAVVELVAVLIHQMR